MPAKNKKRVKPKEGPVKGSLEKSSSLRGSVQDGLSAVLGKELVMIDQSVRGDFSDSLNLDEATKTGREQENRWDYLLGHSKSNKVVALEPHSGKNDQVSKIIKKKEASQLILKDHMRPNKSIESWNWVSSGPVGFLSIDKVNLRLAQNGIRFIGRRLLAKHLP